MFLDCVLKINNGGSINPLDKTVKIIVTLCFSFPIEIRPDYYVPLMSNVKSLFISKKQATSSMLIKIYS